MPTWVVSSDTSAANLQMCALSDAGKCVCLGQPNGKGDAHCVSAEDAGATDTCTLNPLVANDCPRLRTWVTNAEALLGELTLSDGVKTLADRCLTEAQAKLTAKQCP